MSSGQSPRWRVVKQGAHVRVQPGGREIARLSEGDVVEQVDILNFDNRVWIAFLMSAELARQSSVASLHRAPSSDETGKVLVFTVVSDRKNKSPKLVLCEEHDDNKNDDESHLEPAPEALNEILHTGKQALIGGDITAQEYEILLDKIASPDRKRFQLLWSRFADGAAFLRELRHTASVPVTPVQVCPMTFAFTLGVINFAQGLNLRDNDQAVVVPETPGHDLNKPSAPHSGLSCNDAVGECIRPQQFANDPYLHGQQVAAQNLSTLSVLSFERGLETSKHVVSAFAPSITLPCVLLVD